MERDEIVTALTKYFATRSDVVVAYVFGSAARNRRLPGSDIDVGILFAKDAGMADASDASPDEAAEQDAFAMDREAIGAAKRLFLRVEISHALQELLSHPVDVVDLQRTSPHFNHHVLRDKVIIKGYDAPERTIHERLRRRSEC